MAFNSILLLIATILWGYGFVASRWLLQDYTPLWANALRYGLAGLISLPILFKYKSFKRDPQILRMGFIASIMIFASMLLQIYGLKYTTVAKNGFLTIFYALFTPIIMMVVYKKRYSPLFWALVTVAFGGVFLLCDMDFANFNFGDFLTVLCALIFSFHIFYLDKISQYINSAIEFNLIQCLFTGVLGLLAAFIFEGSVDLTPLTKLPRGFIESSLFGLLFLAVASSIVAFSIQVYTQKRISPHIVAMIFLLESPFAALFGYLCLDEKLSLAAFIGCAVVVISVSLVPFIPEKN